MRTLFQSAYASSSCAKACPSQCIVLYTKLLWLFEKANFGALDVGHVYFAGQYKVEIEIEM